MKYLILAALLLASAQAMPPTMDTVCRGDCGISFYPQPEKRFNACRPDTTVNNYYVSQADSVEVNGKTSRTRGPVTVYATKIEWVCQ